jgi:glycosyltransferase involved in cell wall biosynthesis
MPKISIVMPVFNSARWLTQAISSITSQSIADLELIIVNDGSSDGTEMLIADAMRCDPRVRGFHHQHAGVAVTLNRGLDLAQGRFVARMDADDVAHVDRLKTQIAFLEQHPDVVAVGSWAHLIDERGCKTGELRPATQPAMVARLLAKKNPFVHSSMVFPTDVARRLGGYRKALEGAEDYDLWLRISECGQLANVPAFLMDIRIHSTSYSAVGATKQILAARLARIAATQRRAGRIDFIGQEAPADLRRIDSEEARLAYRLHDLLAQRPEQRLRLADLRTVAGARLDHKERKAFQLWLSEVLRTPQDWSTRVLGALLLAYLHPGRALSLIWPALQRRSSTS